jgi:hypothetical protein
MKVFALARDSPNSQNSQAYFTAAVTENAKTGERSSFVCVGICLALQHEKYSIAIASTAMNYNFERARIDVREVTTIESFVG